MPAGGPPAVQRGILHARVSIGNHSDMGSSNAFTAICMQACAVYDQAVILNIYCSSLALDLRRLCFVCSCHPGRRDQPLSVTWRCYQPSTSITHECCIQRDWAAHPAKYDARMQVLTLLRPLIPSG